VRAFYNLIVLLRIVNLSSCYFIFAIRVRQGKHFHKAPWTVWGKRNTL